MFDQQMAQQLSSGKGLGLAQMLVRQLQQASGADVSAKNDSARTAPSAIQAVRTKDASMVGSASSRLPLSAENFVSQILPQAAKAAAQLGVPTRVIVAQAALETGWGGHVMRNADGTSSNNLFGVKADAGWTGARVSQSTTEYQNGSAHGEVAQFRSYSSLDEAFSDYTAFIKNHPRYAAALRSGGGYAQELQKAGYATDPAYAEKIGRIAGSQPLTTALAAAQTQIA
jgi:flagellar protein FlgJ